MSATATSRTLSRWFGIVRRKDNTFSFGSAVVEEYPDHMDFLKTHLGFRQGDTVVELLESSMWQPKDFNHYCSGAYVKGKETDPSKE